MPSKLLVLSGTVFGRLKTVSEVPSDRGRRFKCECICGKEAVINLSRLRGGMTKSCGCLHREGLVRINASRGTHKRTKSPEYNSWKSMKARCLNPRLSEFPRYGGRGINFCSSWNSFEVFLADMGNRPSLHHTLDRVDNSKGYSKENCFWATKKEQSSNTRSNVRVSFEGVEMTLIQAARLSGLSYAAVCGRKNSGWAEADWFIPLIPKHGARSDPRGRRASRGIEKAKSYFDIAQKRITILSSTITHQESTYEK